MIPFESTPTTVLSLQHGRADRYATAVGVIAHAAVNAAAAASREALVTDALLARAWRDATQLVDRADLGMRARAAKLEVVGCVSTYVREFLPPPGWTLEGSEIEVEDGRIDTIWAGPDGGILYDELKAGVGLARRGTDGSTLRQTIRYAAAGRRAHGDAFRGVRLMLLGAPRFSLLIGPGIRRARLAETAYWFGPGREAA